MPTKGLPVALGGVGGSVSGSSAVEDDDELALLELGPAASGLEPPQAATRRAMDEKTPNRESKLMATSWVNAAGH
jgi:hypothetical protein